MPRRRIASNRVMVPVRLARCVPSQSVTPRATEAMAARWNAPSTPSDRGAHGVRIGDVGLDQRYAGGQVVTRSGGQVVEHAHGIAALHERVAQVRTDEASAAGNEVGGHVGHYLSRAAGEVKPCDAGQWGEGSKAGPLPLKPHQGALPNLRSASRPKAPPRAQPLGPFTCSDWTGGVMRRVGCYQPGA